MKIIIVLSLSYFIVCSLQGQNSIIQGRILDEELNVCPLIIIQNNQGSILGQADTTGRFKLKLSNHTDKLIFSQAGMLNLKIHLNDNCDNLEIIMLKLRMSDFGTEKEHEKFIQKRINKISKIHKLAYRKGLFCTAKPCYVIDY